MKNLEELKTIRVQITLENIKRIVSEYNYKRKQLTSKNFLDTYLVYDIPHNIYYISGINSTSNTQIMDDLDKFKALVLLYQL